MLFSIFLILIFTFGTAGSTIYFLNQPNKKMVVVPVKDQSENPTTPVMNNAQFTPQAITKVSATGLDPTDAIDVPMSNGAGNILSQGSILGTLNESNSYIFYQFNLNQSGPVDISVSSPIGTDVFQLYFDVFTDAYGTYLDSAYDGNPVTYTYTAQQAGFNYVAIGGYDVNFADNFDIFAPYSNQVPFNLSVTLHKQGVVTAGSVSTLFQSEAYHKITDIFSFFNSTGYISYNTVDLQRGTFDDSTYLDANDPGFFKGIGLSIYGIIRATDFLSSSNNLSPVDKISLLTQYVDYANQLFLIANDSLNIGINDTNAVYIRPMDSTTAYLSDNAYMLMGMCEILYFASPYYNPDIYYANQVFYDDLYNWAYSIENSIYNIFQDNSTYGNGFFPEEAYNIGLGGPITHGSKIYLESMSILAEDFDQASVTLPLFAEGPTATDDIENQIINKLIILNDVNTTINLVNGTTTGIGVEFWDSTTGKSNTSTLMGNIAYALHLTSHLDINSFEFDYKNASIIALNLLNLFSVPGTYLLKSDALIINDGTNLPVYISTLDNSLFILLAQRLQIKWHDYGNNLDTSRSWGKKALDNYSDLVNVLYDNVDNAFFALYDNQANVIISDDNNVNSNRFVANAFINTILVRLFPVQLGVIASNNQIVGNFAQLSLELSQIPEYDALTWYDFLIPFTFQLTVQIPKFSYISTQSVDLANFFTFTPGATGNSQFINELYKPTVKGDYNVYITLSEEGQTLLSQQFKLTALGQVSAEYIDTDTVFSTDQTSFTAKFTLVDDSGLAVPNLNVNTSLGKALDKNPVANYVKKGRSDASGKVSIVFDVSKLFKDGILNETAILNSNPIPLSVYLTLYVNVTNAGSQNLQQAETLLKIPIKVVISQMDARISPTVLQIVQGTTDAFTFVVTVLNQNQNPVANAKIAYSIDGVPNSNNTVFTNVDGEAVVTFRDNILFGLSNLAIIAKGSTNTTINFNIQQSSYPTKTIQKSISILGNNLKITANPVQTNIKQPSIFDSNKLSPIDVEVAVEDSFGRVIPAEVRLAWNDSSLNSAYNLDDLGTHIAPYTFSIDPNKLPVGELNFMIIATKDGITTTHQVTGTSQAQTQFKIASTNSASQNTIINNPVVITRKIIVEPSTISDILISIVGILSGLIIAKVATMIRERGEEVVGITRSCPHCEEIISGNSGVCSHCGRDVEPLKKKNKKGDNSGGSGNIDNMTQESEKESTDQESQSVQQLSTEEEELIKSVGAPDLTTAQAIVKAGFSDYETYQKAKEQGISTFVEWESKNSSN